ncbi:hypothetical protein [Helicobacter sp.]|uniref:hypothetical protein n=1 Tax=Helicobacter sp. TaxID=218 RepID=UPI0025C3284D|nr:hypothetical protein [Helicobacter sp.]MCI5969057.1 hypothetical protein [Helicobacter sp.]MDY2585353.1 hypothetical protein [Helicobacter sp.]
MRIFVALVALCGMLFAIDIKDFKKACEVAQGRSNLGLMYVEGEGVRQNLKIAKEYFGKVCDLGLEEGCEGYKILNMKGY